MTPMTTIAEPPPTITAWHVTVCRAIADGHDTVDSLQASLAQVLGADLVTAGYLTAMPGDRFGLTSRVPGNAAAVTTR